MLDSRCEMDAFNVATCSQERDEFFPIVSHELRTPLTSVIAFADIMSRNRDDNLTGIQLEQLDIIRRNGQYLNDLVEGMLDISRLNTDMMRLELSEF